MINKINFVLLLIVIQCITAFSSTTAENTGTLHIDFFGSVTCDECMRIKAELLHPLSVKHKEKLAVTFHDIETDSGIKTLINFEKKYNVTTNASQLLFFPDTFLSGFEDIMKHGSSMIEIGIGKVKFTEDKRNASSDSVDLKNVLQSKTLQWGFFLGTLVTGLIDGVNPCAIATMIFLISFLATRKRNRNEILLIGIAYTATVFITYLAMGLGLKGVLEHIKGYHIISTFIRWGAFGLAVIVAILSFRDAFVFSKTKKTEEIALQLPKAVKLRIHKIISGNLSGRNLVIGSIITGFLVTLLEAICTGQMYVPYIIAMTQQPSLRAAGYLYLIFYNFLFVLPLLIVIILAYFGLKWNDLAKQTQKKMVLLKVLLGIIMTGLAIYLAVGSGFVG
jgi:hypothetical protein